MSDDDICCQRECQIVTFFVKLRHFFVKLGHLLAKTDKRIVHNYIIWRLVMDLMPHMPPQYEGTRAEFRRVLLGVLTDR